MFFFFKQKTAYEMRISDWSSDVCSSDLGNFPFIGNGKAIALGEVEGFVKTVFDAKTGELLGAHMVGAEVTEMIQGYTVGKTAELVEEDFMHSVYSHTTISETMHEALPGAYGRPPLICARDDAPLVAD